MGIHKTSQDPSQGRGKPCCESDHYFVSFFAAKAPPCQTSGCLFLLRSFVNSSPVFFVSVNLLFERDQIRRRLFEMESSNSIVKTLDPLFGRFRRHGPKPINVATDRIGQLVSVL
jgi:hypothetical protein